LAFIFVETLTQGGLRPYRNHSQLCRSGWPDRTSSWRFV
jgi:hypothetical protein